MHRLAPISENGSGVNRGELAGLFVFACNVPDLKCFSTGDSELEETSHWSNSYSVRFVPGSSLKLLETSYNDTVHRSVIFVKNYFELFFGHAESMTCERHARDKIQAGFRRTYSPT